MLISNKKKFIFIHIPKCAGQSVTSILLKYCISTKERFVTKIIGARNYIRINTKLQQYFNFSLYGHNFSDHARAYAVKDALGDSYDDYFKFAFVRNPWDWLFSNYTYALKNIRHYRHTFIKNNFKDFNEFVEWECLENNNKKYQKEFIYDSSGNLIVDFVGKFENLKTDFDIICNKLNLENQLPHFNQSSKKSYKEYYSQRTKALVEEHYREDIKLLDYKF